MNLDQTVREAGARFGQRSAYVSPTGWEMSYAALDALADEVAAGLIAAGVTEGAVVAASMPPRPEYIVLQVAAARAGAALAGINHKLADSERAALLELCQPAVVVAGDDPATSADEVLVDLRGHGTAPPPLTPDPERPLAIVFTSGTTGTPRGAVYAQRQVDFITRVDTGGVWGDPDTAGPHGMSGMSLTHLGPTTKLQGNLMRGGTTHLLERWSPTTALGLIERHGMSMIAGVPTQVTLMLHHPDFDRFDTSSVRAVVMGGGPAKPALVREVRDRLGVPVMVRYSCTEAGIGVGTTASDDPSDAECSVGRPHPGVDLTIRDGSGEPLPGDDVGEVCLASPATMSGYWRDPEATEAARWPDGAIRTGDLGSIDESGRLHLAGRAGDMYVRGGYNVHPGEVESALAGCPGVADVAVVGVPDDVMGEKGLAAVVAEPGSSGPDLSALRAFGEQSLARHKLPEALVLLDELPLTAMEKLDRRALRDLVDDSPPDVADGTNGAGGEVS